jgi:hypothetical protein
MLKKMMLLAAAVTALVAFAAPAAASADQWYTDTLGGEETVTEDEVHFQGTLTATAPGTALTCGVTAVVDVSNPGGVATGETTSAAILAPATGCQGVFGGGLFSCPITNGIASAGHINVATGATGVEIEEASFIDFFPSTCPAGTVIAAEGPLTGTWNNTGSCIEFSNDGDLETPTGTAVTVDGRLCETTETLTLHS